jgi:hypothetical protein
MTSVPSTTVPPQASTAVATSGSRLPMPALIKTINALVVKAEQSAQKTEEYWKAIGLHLMEAKDRFLATPSADRDTDAKTWPAFCRKHFTVKRRRADELITIADGRTTVEKIRDADATKKRKSRKTKSSQRRAAAGHPARSADQEDDDDDEPTDAEAARLAFLIRAGEAQRYAVIDVAATIDADVAKAALATADTWTRLAAKLVADAVDTKADRETGRR